MSIDVALIVDTLPMLLQGLWLTLQLLLTSLAGGLVLSIPLAFALAIPLPGWMFALNGLAQGYIWFFRGTPALVQLFLVYYGLSQFEAVRNSFLWIVLREPFWCCALAFSLNSAAYTAEIIRGAMNGVEKSQREAAFALGLSKLDTFRQVTWPQALRLAIPPYSNEVVGMLKTTALASTVTLAEITGIAETIAAQTFAPYEVFLSAAAIYLILAFLIERLQLWCERALRTEN